MRNCIMVALAGWGPLKDSLHGLADRLAVPEHGLRGCLRQLVRERLVAIQTQPGGWLTVRKERRSRGVLRVSQDRRRHQPPAWRL
jgi:hypothetical protein